MTMLSELRVVGSVTVHSRGFGFLNFQADEEQLSAFVAPPDLNPFLAGDLVSATVSQGEDGRYSASQLRLEKRDRAVLFGEVVKRREGLLLKIDDEVANTDWPLQGEARPGSQVLAAVDGSEAHLVRVLDADDDVDLERLIARFDLVEEFDEECTEEAQSIQQRPHSVGARRDLRDIPTITIDAPSTSDLDDAVAALPADSEGAVRLLVSIADPAEFITEGSELDLEARARGTSTYLSDRVLPMLPHSLSSGHLSLLPATDRCCLTVEMRIDIEGEICSVDVYESVIRTKTRVSYRELASWLSDGQLSDNLRQVEDLLPWLRTAAARISVARRRRGGVRVAGEESAQVTFTDKGELKSTRGQVITEAHTMVERFMVAANEAVAGWLKERGFPGIYRVHPEPDSDKVELLSESARQFGFFLGLKGRVTPLALAAFDRQIRDVASEWAIRSVLRGILERARYTPTPGPHLGLGSPLYLHFTSPLRRYADLVVHRLIKAYLSGDRSSDPEDPKFKELCDHLNHRNALAAKAESLRRRMLLAELMLDRIGEDFDARVTRVLPFGLVAQLDHSLVEGLIPFSSLGGGPWVATPMSAKSSKKEITLGLAVRVKLIAAEPSLGQLEYELLDL